MPQIDRQRWSQIESVFDACIDLDPPAQARVLDRLTAGDPELRLEVLSLLAQGWPDRALEAAVQIASGEALAVPGQIVSGDTIGAYQLERCLGEGGMGEVWLASRADAEFERKVAIKFVLDGGAARGWIKRFRAERRILAQLDHPHIARLLDGGTTRAGQPYLVMEYVEGEPLLAYCDRRRLGLPQRIELFRKICAAVEHAHQNLIVHRDIKPANVLVNAEHGPKLLDFGIAKVLPAGSDTERGLQTTRAHERLLTPDYASPEQLLGEAVTTASDVFALGVLLFELLSGTRPRAAGSLGALAVTTAVTRGAVSRPSEMVRKRGHRDSSWAHDTAAERGLRPAELAGRLRGDLDTIVLKAMQHEPGRRYPSAAALADDLRRYLAALPVEARPDALGYRLGKWIRRHPIAAASGGLAVLALIGFVVVLALQSQRIATQRDRALLAEHESNAVSDFLVDLFKVSDPGTTRGEAVTAGELLERGRQQIAVGLADQPRVQARMMYTLGDVYFNLGRFDRAELLHRDALRRRVLALGEQAAETAASHDRLGDVLRTLERFPEAELQLRQGLAIRAALQPPEPAGVADSLNNLGLLLTELGRRDEAESALRHALMLREAQPDPGDDQINATRVNLAQLLRHAGRLQEAQSFASAALEHRRRYLGQHLKTASAARALAQILEEMGRSEAAEQLLLETLAIERLVLAPRHPRLITTLNNLAYVYHDQLRVADAESYYREVLALDRQRAGQAATIELATSLNNLAALLVDLGRIDEALPLLTESLGIRAEKLGEANVSYMRVLGNRGAAYAYAGRWQPAEADLQRVRRWQQEQSAPESVGLSGTLQRLAYLAHARRQATQAVAWQRQAIMAADHALEKSAGRIAVYQAELAWLLAENNDIVGCIEASAAAEQSMQSGTLLPIERGRVLFGQAVCDLAAGRRDPGQRRLQAAQQLLRPLSAANVWNREIAKQLTSRAAAQGGTDGDRSRPAPAL